MIVQSSPNSSPKNTPEKTLVSWTSPARPYQTRTREFYTTVFSIVFLLGVILLLLKEFLLIGVIIAFAFLSYVLSSYKPDNITHRITTKGINSDNQFHAWVDFNHYWLEQKYNQELVILKTKKALPGIIILVLDPNKKSAIIKAINQYIPEEKPQDNFVTKASTWLSEKIPLESNSQK